MVKLTKTDQMRMDQILSSQDYENCQMNIVTNWIFTLTHLTDFVLFLLSLFQNFYLFKVGGTRSDKSLDGKRSSSPKDICNIRGDVYALPAFETPANLRALYAENWEVIVQDRSHLPHLVSMAESHFRNE